MAGCDEERFGGLGTSEVVARDKEGAGECRLPALVQRLVLVPHTPQTSLFRCSQCRQKVTGAFGPSSNYADRT